MSEQPEDLNQINSGWIDADDLIHSVAGEMAAWSVRCVICNGKGKGAPVHEEGCSIGDSEERERSMFTRIQALEAELGRNYETGLLTALGKYMAEHRLLLTYSFGTSGHAASSHSFVLFTPARDPDDSDTIRLEGQTLIELALQCVAPQPATPRSCRPGGRDV